MDTSEPALISLAQFVSMTSRPRSRTLCDIATEFRCLWPQSSLLSQARGSHPFRIMVQGRSTPPRSLPVDHTRRPPPRSNRRGAKRETSRQGRYFILFVRPSLLAGLITPGRGTCLPSVIESTAEWSSEQRILVEHSHTLLFGLASRSQTRLVDDRVVTLAYRERTGSR